MNKLLIGTILGLAAFLLLSSNSYTYTVGSDVIYSRSPAGFLFNFMVALGIGVIAWGLLAGWDSVFAARDKLGSWAKEVLGRFRPAGAPAPVVEGAELSEDEQTILFLYRQKNWKLLQQKSEVDERIQAEIEALTSEEEELEDEDDSE